MTVLAGDYFSPLFLAVWTVFYDAETFKYIIFFTTALLSVVHTPAWSCINLLALVERIPSMYYVFIVLKKNGDQMVSTLVFAFMCAFK